MTQMGRIGGPLLADNLLRNGNNLAFDSSVLYLDVANKYIGFNTNTPVRDLTVNGNIRPTVNLIGTTSAVLGDLEFTSNSVQNVVGTITISPAQSSPVVNVPGLGIGNLQFTGSTNTLSNTVANDVINISPTGQLVIGTVPANNSATVNGSLHATGNVTFDGDIVLGNAPTDTITFAAGVSSDIVPQVLNIIITPISEQITDQLGNVITTETGQPLFTDPGAPYLDPNYLYSLGSTSLAWNTVYVNTFTFNTSVNLSSLTVGTMTSGNIVVANNNIGNAINDITLIPSGTGSVKFSRVNYINGNNINNTTNSVLTMGSTGLGYTVFDGTSGVVIPSGNTAQSLTLAVQGGIRWNTQVGYMQVYSGSAWQPAIGVTGALTQSQVQDIMFAWDLILG